MRNKDIKVRQVKSYIASELGGRNRLNQLHETFEKEMRRLQKIRQELPYKPNNNQ